MASRADEWVIVSGAAGALGSAFVGHYAVQGRRVLALDLNEPAAGAGGRLQTASVDLTSVEAVDEVLGRIPRGDPIGLLVNAVGLIWNEPVLALRGARFVVHGIESWRRVMDANVTASFVLATRVAARMARSGGGAIVNVSSVSARGNAGQVAYSAAKAAVEGMTRAMAAELGPMQVRVNAVAPGFIDVESTRSALSPETLTEYQRRTPLQRLGTVDELIQAVDFLDQNAFVTGVVLDVDGGMRV